MADAPETPTPRPPTRAERLAKVRDDFIEWGKTATTDDIPGDLSDASEAPSS